MPRWPFIVVLAVACRSPSSVHKQPAFDFESLPGPGAGAFASEATLLDRWNVGVTPLRSFWDTGEEGHLIAPDKADLVYRVHRAPSAKAAVVLLPGRTEAIIKYAEVAQDLVQQGYTTYALTLRGQGEASRLLTDPNPGYVASFEDYVDDTRRFIRDVVRPAEDRVFVLAHSTGGLVSVLLMDENPKIVEAAAMTSPMLEIDLGSYPPPVAATLGEGMCSATDGTGYVLGGGPWSEETDFAGNSVTGSQARFKWKVQQQVDDPAIRLGSSTWRWLCQSLDASSRGQGLGAFNETPLLMLQAGADKVVKPGGQARYCAEAPRCTLVAVEGAKHEILQEADSMRNPSLDKIVAFFDAQVNP